MRQGDGALLLLRVLLQVSIEGRANFVRQRDRASVLLVQDGTNAVREVDCTLLLGLEVLYVLLKLLQRRAVCFHGVIDLLADLVREAGGVPVS